MCTYLLDERELFFVPCVNPDGYVYNEATDPAGGGMWRKNRRDNGDGTFGVDLNRNYGHQWGIDDSGSSPIPMSDTYRGPSPFSEPETQAMRNFIEGRSFVTKHSHHCRGHLLIHAWGWGPAPCPDCEVLEAYAQRMTEDNGFIYGDTYGALNYYANGSATDWSYAEHGVLGYVPETGTLEDGFWPVPDRIVPLAQANMEQNLLLALFAGAYAESEDTSPRAASGPSAQAEFSVKRYGQQQAAIEVSIEPLLNIVSTGAPATFDALDVNESAAGSISIALDPGMQPGERFRYVLATACDGLVHRDTIERVLGASIVIFSDDCSNDDDWGGGWAIDPIAFASPPAAFSDSPMGSYGSFAENEWGLAQPLDLSLATSATLYFKAKWQLQSELDHVRVEGSSDGVAWTALCGKYARQGYPMQGEGEPVYDGMRHEWTAERIVLDGFIGGPLYLRFGLISDDFFTYDGFHLDDVSVEITGGILSGIAQSESASEMRVHPVPASRNVYVDHGSAGAIDGRIILRDAQGRLAMSVPLASGSSRTEVDITALAGGMYACSIEGASVRLVGRLVVAH
ncbi:MAG: immune inhibitor A [Flavobacteriales bacterium]|nr:immune inhibitor A [Flavobacteriales bacterium]